jgi:DNA-binding beta-propeller fold protein YncE
MAESHRVRRTSLRGLLVAGLSVGLMLISGHPSYYAAESQFPNGRLVRMEALPKLDREVCLIPAETQRAARRAENAAAIAAQRQRDGLPFGSETTIIAGDPNRRIRDNYPAFAAIGVDPERGEVTVTDENLFQVLTYDRLENAAPEAISKPKRVLSGDTTLIEFQSGLYVDPVNGDLFAPNNDTVDTLVVFAQGGNGDIAPKRALHTPHGTFGIAVDEKRGEMYLTTQHDATVVVFRKNADKNEAPIRLLQGDDTGLADPHGIAIDPVKEVFYVANYGSRASRDAKREIRTGVPGSGKGRDRENWPYGREYAIPGSGSHAEPSITIHALGAKGNDKPVGKIQGPKTQLNWPTGIAFDPERRELFVANDMGPSILVFDAEARGDVAPKRVLKGAKTKLANPTSVALDRKNGELWVANFGGHTATAYKIDAVGDTPPLRTIRAAPESAPSLMIGNPGALTYDSKRQEILVPN